MKRPLYKSQPLVDLYCDPADIPPEPLSPTGGPLSPEPVKRVPYDSLYLKQKYDRDYFRK